MTSAEQPTEKGPQPEPARSASNWTFGRVIGLIFTAIAGLIGLALLLGGIAIIAAFAFGRDDDGYFTTDRKALESDAYAITTEDIDLGADGLDWAPDEVLGTIRLQVEATKPVFVGIGTDVDVDRYLARVEYDELIEFHGGEPDFELHKGRAPRSPPAEQDFWVAQTQGQGGGEQDLKWDAEFGRWTAVVMNADAAPGIDVEADAGVKLGWAIWAGLGLLVVGLIMTAGAVAVILLIGRRASRDARPA